MKKITSIIILSALTLTACGNSKWDQTDKEIDPGLREHEKEIISEQEAILDADPLNVDALFQLGFEYQFLGDYKQAVDYYEQVLNIDGRHVPALNNLADIYEQVEEYDTAAKYVKRLYSEMPDNSEVIKDTVRILLLADDADSADQALTNYARLMREGGEIPEGTSTMISNLKQQIVDHKKLVKK